MIAVIGGGECDPETARRAEIVGRLVAEAGGVVVCGGLGGVMEAACRGAKQAGGLTLGILPGTDRNSANPFVDIALPTGLSEARNCLVVRIAQAVIAIGGEFGTLSEIGFALKLGIPVIGLGTWDLGKEGRRIPCLQEALNPEQAVRLALESASGLDRNPKD